MAQFDEDAIRRIIRSVLYTEKVTIANLVRDEMGFTRQMPFFTIVRGKTVSSVAATDDTFEIEEVHPLGQSAPHPGEPLTIVNVPSLTLAAGATAYALYKYAVLAATGTADDGTGTGDGNWEALAVTGVGGSQSIVMIVDTVDAMEEVSGTDFTAVPGHLYLGGTVLERVGGTYNLRPVMLEPAGTGTGTGTEDDTGTVYDQVTVLNFTKTPIRASVDQPIILMGTIEELSAGADSDEPIPGTGTGTEPESGSEAEETERVFIVASDKDIRSYPNFQKAAPQIVFHLADDEAGKLEGEECGTGTGTGS